MAHDQQTCIWCRDDRGVEPGVPVPPVDHAARQALALGAALTIVALTVALVVYLLGSPPT